jgi:hypothetical protein
MLDRHQDLRAKWISRLRRRRQHGQRAQQQRENNHHIKHVSQK